MANKPAPAATPEAPADPFANLTATETDVMFTGSGRPGTTIPESVKAMVEKSYNVVDGKPNPKVFRVDAGSEAQAKELRKLLQKAGERHDPALTVRTTIEEDKRHVRFKAGPKVTKATATAETTAEVPAA